MPDKPTAIEESAIAPSEPANELANEQPTKPTAERRVPEQRWQVFPAQTAQANHIAEATALSPLLAQVLINRGIYTPEQAWEFLDPETLLLPSPIDEFPDLAKSLEILVSAINTKEKILICGDYDADGMTSTALLMRSLRYLGGQVSYAIPSRMDEGYGINQRIVEEFHAAGGRIILTVDNGIAAYEPIARAADLGLTVILTDHHDVPETLPPASAILNPKLIRETSPYRGVAGVGVAYILAVCLAQRMGKMQDLTATLLALFTLGTIADLAPLTGVNRRWVKRGLKLLPKSTIPGIQALIEVAGLSEESELKPEAIGFRLGPRINAVGRIADPQIVIDLLTTDDVGVALQRAMQCEETNQLRRQMCEIIETQAVDWCEAQIESGLLDLEKERVIVVVQPEWHHGVIGIVASRLVERYGVPVFIGTFEDKAKKEIRGSARSIPEFNVFEALQFCDDLLAKYGGHRAAGGFSFQANKLRQVKSRLSNYACKQLQLEHLKPLVTVDAQASLSDVDLELYTQIDQIHPCGIDNPEPVFWAENVTVVDQQLIGKNSAHLKLTLAHTEPSSRGKTVLKAIAWRWGRYHPMPRAIDIAFKPRLNEWRGRRTVEIELVGARQTLATGKTENGIRPWSSQTQAALSPKADTPANTASAREVARRLQAQIQGDVHDTTMAAVTATPSAEPSTVEDPPINSLTKDPTHLSAIPPIPSAEQQQDISGTAFSTVPPIADSQRRELAERRSPAPTALSKSEHQTKDASLHVEFYHSRRRYKGTLENIGSERQLTIENAESHLLVVQLNQRRGFLYLPSAQPQAVDIAELRYFNLIRAGLNALEVKQKTQVLIKQQELLSEKDAQISTMKAQIELLEDKITQLSNEQQQQLAVLKTEMQVQESTIQGQEAHIEQLQVQVSSVPLPNAADLKQQVRSAVSDSVWFCLQAASQRDLIAAYKNDYMIHSSGPDSNIADYSEAGIRLSFAVEREVITPFFEDLYSYLLSQGVTEIGGVALGPNCKYTLGMLPPLLADQWRTFQPGQLSERENPAGGVRMVKFQARGQVSGRDRTTLQQFFAQWEHPMTTCLSQKGRQAASSLDQISKLRNIAAHGESFLYRWQYELLHQLIAGKQGKGGLLRELFALG
ncbi:MAG: single-stranded-DNA-specific exonuclease RecJ [Cyanobacteria bacterium J06627_32]